MTLSDGKAKGVLLFSPDESSGAGEKQYENCFFQFVRHLKCE